MKTINRGNIQIQPGKWFVTYKGYIYANTPTEIHDRINNKAVINTLPKLTKG